MKWLKYKYFEQNLPFILLGVTNSTNDKILIWANNKSNDGILMISVFHRVESIVGKKENASLPAFFPLAQCF